MSNKNKYKYCGIYLIKIGKYRYVGQSIDITNRIKQHKRSLKQNRHSNYYMQNVYNKYKEFEYVILCKCEEVYLTILEQTYINMLDDNIKLNLTGAQVYSKEHRQAISKANKTSKKNLESLAKARKISASKPKTEAQMKVAYRWVKSMNTVEANTKSARSRKNNLKVITAARNRKASDSSIYTIENKTTKEIFIGTRSEFAEHTGVNSGRTSDLVRRGYYKNWLITHKDHSPR